MTTLPMDPRIRARRAEVLRLRGRRRLRTLGTATAIVGLAVIGWWVVEQSPLFDVDAVVVDGVVRTQVSEVIEAANIEQGQPLVEVDTSAAREAIAELPWVADVRSDRSLGGAVSFLVTERSAAATAPGLDGWLVLDAEGRVLELTDVSPPGLPVLGAPKSSVAPGDWVGDDVLPLLEVSSGLAGGLAPKVASVEAGQGGLELQLVGGGKVLIGTTDELDAKFLSALTMLVRLDLQCLDAIDVRAPAVPVLTRIEGCS